MEPLLHGLNIPIPPIELQLNQKIRSQGTVIKRRRKDGQDVNKTHGVTGVDPPRGKCRVSLGHGPGGQKVDEEGGQGVEGGEAEHDAVKGALLSFVGVAEYVLDDVDAAHG